MKRQLNIFVMSFVMFLFLTSCAGTGDWTYPLPNNYEVCHIHSEEILMKCVNAEYESDTIPSFVK